MDLQKLYAQIKAYIDQVDFERLWSGFKPLKFALYNETSCCFDGAYINKTGQFVANTSIVYQGEHIAIWQVQGELAPVVLASKIIHEMFHAFQMTQNWNSFPNEMEALQQYTCNTENLSVKLHENRLLLKLAKAYDEGTYREILACRAYRSSEFPYAYRYEACTEDIEGSANYVEWMALKQLDPKQADALFRRMESSMLNPESFFPIRVSCYHSGALMIHAARTAGERIDSIACRPLGMYLIQNTEATPIAVDNDSVAKSLSAYQTETDHIIQSALELNDIVWDQPAHLLCVNIYDARCKNGFITSRCFVMVEEMGKQKILNGNFVIKMLNETTVETIFRWPQAPAT